MWLPALERPTWTAPPGGSIAQGYRDLGATNYSILWTGQVVPRYTETYTFLGTSDDEFEWAMRMNFFVAVRAIRAALVPMVARGSGAIVNVASVNAFYQPDATVIDYGAAKAALANLTKALAQEFGPRGIHVNAVSPGPVSTDLWLGEQGVAETVAHATGVDADTARKTIVAGMGGFATGRFSTPDEVATLVVFLASERTANVTGANYVIDGGLIKTT